MRKRNLAETLCRIVGDAESIAILPPMAAKSDDSVICSPTVSKLGMVSAAEFMSLGFSHHMTIISQTDTLEERLFYIREAAQNHWGRNRLAESIKRDDFHHRGAMPSNFAATIPDAALARKTLAIRTPPWVSFSASRPTSRMSSTPYATTTSRWAWRPTERLTKCQRASNAHFRQSTNFASNLRSQG